MFGIQTGYSFRRAVGTVDEHMSRLVELGATFAPIADFASTFGWVRWSKAAKKAGLQPLFGVSLAVSASISAKKPVSDIWSFFAKDDIAVINRLLHLATSQFRYTPLLSYEQAMEAEGMFKLVGPHSLFDQFAPQDDLFIALAPNISKGYYTEAATRGHKFIQSCCAKYPRPEDEDLYEILCGRMASTQTYDQFVPTQGQWRASMARTVPAEALDAATIAASAVAGQCKAGLKMAELLVAEKPVPLEQMCRQAAPRLGVDLSNPVYEDRLIHELHMIHEKKFEDYFYIIADMMQWARKRLACGPARGSAAGSLVCYLLDITTVEPIKYGLLFERFIDVTRNDLPDIDLDLSDQKRHMVFEYMEQKYGSDHVARLGTVMTYRPRSAIAEAGAALRVPPYMCDKVIGSLIVRSSGDARALQTLADTFTGTTAGKELMDKYPEIAICANMEGHPRSYGQHAAGIVVVEKPLMEYVAVDARTGATFCDKKDAEDLNLLKIDALGLTQLSVFEDALIMAGLPLDYLESIPLDDQAAYDVINKKQFSGIFQFNGNALQTLAKQIVVDCFNDYVLITSLARPGPMTGGGAMEWARRRMGKKPVTYPHELFKPYLEETLGIVVYQEQVLLIGRNIGGMTWAETQSMRRAMSKSMGKEYFDQWGDKFKAHAATLGVLDAEKIWDEIAAYGAMTFNKSHGVSYAFISYWCCYMKAHFPFEFAAATLTHESDPMEQIHILREMALEGFDYVPVDKEQSTDKWTAGIRDGKKVLIGPLTGVKSIGPKMAQQILGARARGEPMPARADKLLTDPKTAIDSLFPIRDALARIMPNPAERNIHTPATPLRRLQPNGEYQRALAFVVFTKINVRDENEDVNVAKRGGQRITDGMTTSLILHMVDDTDKIFGKINRKEYDRIGKEIYDRGLPGKAIYAVKGDLAPEFRMMHIKQVRFLGLIGDEGKKDEAAERFEQDATSGLGGVAGEAEGTASPDHAEHGEGSLANA